MFISHLKQIVEETLKHKINLSPVHLFSYLQWRSHTNKTCLEHFSLRTKIDILNHVKRPSSLGK